MFDANGSHVSLLGEKNVPSSPLFCTAKFFSLSNKDEIEEVFLCYSLCHMLSNSFHVSQGVNCGDLKCDVNEESSSALHSSPSHSLKLNHACNATSNTTQLSHDDQ